MKAGELRHRVRIQQLVTGRDDTGGFSETWADVATVWAAIEPIRGREYFEAQQVNAEVSHRIKCRYRSGILPVMRAVFGVRIFRIEAVINVDERNRELQLMCIEAVAA